MSARLLAEQERLATRLSNLITRAAGWIDPPGAAGSAAPTGGNGASAWPASRARDAAGHARTAAPTARTARAGDGPVSLQTELQAGAPEEHAAGAWGASATRDETSATPPRAAAAPPFQLRRLRRSGLSADAHPPARATDGGAAGGGQAAFTRPGPAHRASPQRVVPPASVASAPHSAAPPDTDAHAPVGVALRPVMPADPNRATAHMPNLAAPYRAAWQGAAAQGCAVAPAATVFADAELEERIAALLDDALTETGTEAGPDLR